MLFRKVFSKYLALFLAAGVLALSGVTFAEGGLDLTEYDKMIEELRDEQRTAPVEGRNYKGLIDLVNNNKQLAELNYKRKQLNDELSDADRRRIGGRFLESSDLVPFHGVNFNPFRIFNGDFFEDFDKTFGNIGKKMFGLLGDKEEGGLLALPDMNSKLGGFEGLLPEKALKKVSKLGKSGKPKVLIFDGEGNEKVNLTLENLNLEQLERDYKDIGLKDAVNNLLRRADIGYQLGKDDKDFSIVFSPGKIKGKNGKGERNGLVCFSQKSGKNGASSMCSSCSFSSFNGGDFFSNAIKDKD